VRVLAIGHQRDAGPGVFAEAAAEQGADLDVWWVAETEEPPADPRRYDAVMVFGGAMHADQEEAHPWLRAEKELLADLLGRDTPVLGVCLGTQLLAEAAGAPARRASRPEIGWHEVELMPEAASDPVMSGLPDRFEALGWHSYEAPLPPGAQPLAHSPVCLQAYRTGERAWGIQFHAEVSAEDAERWIRDYEADPDAVAIGLDPDAFLAATRRRIGAWNDLGRALCRRFLAEAAR
jgi:GMP synthase-like glutamine amidotransferase